MEVGQRDKEGVDGKKKGVERKKVKGSQKVCVCVCVCEREREREREKPKKSRKEKKEVEDDDKEIDEGNK